MFPNNTLDYRPETYVKLFCAKCEKYIEHVESYGDPLLLRFYLKGYCHSELIEFHMDSVKIQRLLKTKSLIEVTV